MKSKPAAEGSARMSGPTGEDRIATEDKDQYEAEEWRHECLKYRGEVLTGRYAHYCFDWDGLPIDETCIEWPCCDFKPEGITEEEKAEAQRVSAAVHLSFDLACDAAHRSEQL